MECAWQVRLATKRRIEPTPDYATLKRDPIVAAAYVAALRRGLATVMVEGGDTAGRLRRLCEATAQAVSGTSPREAPAPAQAGGQRKHETSIRGASTVLPPAEPRGATTPRYRHRTSVS